MNPLTDPDGFFSERLEQEIGLKSPALIVLVAGVIAAVNAYIIAGMVMEAIVPTLPPEAAGFAKIGSIFGAVAALFVTFLIFPHPINRSSCDVFKYPPLPMDK
jgi:hypothetical protein